MDTRFFDKIGLVKEKGWTFSGLPVSGLMWMFFLWLVIASKLVKSESRRN